MKKVVIDGAIYDIENNIPYERKTANRGSWQKLLDHLGVGDSFILADAEDTSDNRIAALRQSAKGRNMVIRSASTGDGIRVWRTE